MIAGDLDPQEIDLLARVAKAEGGSDPYSQAAVLSVIRNRLASGKFGNDLIGVVTAPHQFETISNGTAGKVDPISPAYQSAARVAHAVFAPGAPDPTGGATHFYAPGPQAELAKVDGRPVEPTWAAGQTPLAVIGGQNFYAPQGRVTPDMLSYAPMQPQGGALDANGGNALPATPAAAPNAGPARPAPPPQDQPQAQPAAAQPALNGVGMSAGGALAKGLNGGFGGQHSLIGALLQKYVSNPLSGLLGLTPQPPASPQPESPMPAAAAQPQLPYGNPMPPSAPIQSSPLAPPAAPPTAPSYAALGAPTAPSYAGVPSVPPDAGPSSMSLIQKLFGQGFNLGGLGG